MALLPVPLLLLFILISSLEAQYTGQNLCTSKETCHECIRTPSCAWCFQHMRDHGDQPRCFQPSSPSPLKGHCPDEFTYYPGNVLITLLNQHLSLRTSSGGGAAVGGIAWGEAGAGGAGAGSAGFAGGSASGAGAAAAGQIVQVAPQHIHLKLRERESYSFSMFYTQAEDYPVDLYYLMDLSKSMEDDKDKLSLLGNLLADSMRNITSNFRLGFGSFVDKVVMPYVSTIPKNLKEPCPDCQPPYGYHHAMPLSTDAYRFSEKVKNASVSGNLDAPEGGFDAIMQAIVCEREIGWRKDARKLLVFSTDAGFHYAGDGKLGGIIKPNDGHCHLNSQGMYSHSTLQDYPSIAQINHKVKQHTVNVIFAVTEEQYGVYEKLKGFIEGATSGKLSADSSNIVDLIKKQYEKISSAIELTERNKPEYVKIKYFTRCLNESAPLRETSRCEKVRVGDLIKFELEITLEKCPENRSEWNQTFEIKPVGIDESLTINLEMLCSCPCEFPGDPGYIKNAQECKGVGTYKCGICECDDYHFGTKCECSVSGMYHRTDSQGCKNPNMNTTLDCSGHGDCVCNRCDCEIRPNGDEFYGTWCECNDFTCLRYGGKLCGGHGKCVCGECKCDASWTEPDCRCHNVTDTCYPPLTENAEICSGNGDCVCGSCVCRQGKGGSYLGKYCDKCPGCHDRCDDFRECVQCQLYKAGGPITDEDECIKTCKGITPVSVDVVRVIEENDENLCAGIDYDDCRYAFVYYVKDGKINIRAQEKRDCPVKVYLLGIVLGVIALVVLMGLAILLLWKLLTTIHDRKEFARFEKERMMAKWDTGENPIYKQATSTFKNPTYAGKG